MIGAAAYLLGLAAADAAAGGVSGNPHGVVRAAVGVAVGIAVMLASRLFFAPGPLPVLELAAGALSIAGWLALRASPGLASGPWPLVWLGGSVLWLVVASPGEVVARPGLAHALAQSPWPGLASAAPGEVLFVGASFAALTSTANAVVRSILTLAGSNIGSAETTLLGGRIIGILERWLIFGFVLAGEATAAALVVSAKSLIRFPELSSARDSGGAGAAGSAPEAPRPVDVVTEYFLLGSLSSWLLALLPATLLR